MDQYLHKTDIYGIIFRTTLRTLQLVFAITIMGIYGPDLAHSSATKTSAHPEWIFAQVAACLSALTCMIYCTVTVTRVAWCLWDWVLCVLWAAQAGVFGSIYLMTENSEQYVGATSSEERMRAGVGIGLVNMVLWLVTGILGVALCYRARRLTRRGKPLKAGVPDQGHDGGEDVGNNDLEKGADEKSDGEEPFLSGANADDKKPSRKEHWGFERDGMCSLSPFPSYKSI